MMHSVPDSYGASGVPAFLHKLWTLVDDESTDDLIAWDASGNSFHVFDQSRFSKEVLPLYFKHSNIASFVRQLNMYGFKKVSNVEHGSLKVEKDDMEFFHQYFKRDHEELLDNIKRKVATSKDDVKVKTDEVTKVLRDVHSLKGRQENISSKMDTLERENEALWREVANLRQKHTKQQKIVNKLIQFLVTLVGNRGLGGGLKRKMPLMINDSSQLQNPRPPKIARQYSLETGTSSNPANIQVIPDVKSPESITEYVPASSLKIEEMTDNYPTEPPPVYAVYADNSTSSNQPTSQPQTIILVDPNNLQQQNTSAQNTNTVLSRQVPSPAPSAASPVQQVYADQLSPSGYVSTEMVNPQVQQDITNEPVLDNFLAPEQQLGMSEGLGMPTLSEPTTLPFSSPSYSQTSPRTETTTTVAIPEPSANSDHLVDVNGHLTSIEDSLDNLKDLLSGNIDANSLWNLRLDSDTLQGLFTPEAPIPATPEPFLGMADPEKPNFLSTNEPLAGNELIQYNPNEDLGSLLELGVLSPTDPATTSDESLAFLDSSGGLQTPKYDVDSPLARRRKSAQQPITTEEID